MTPAKIARASTFLEWRVCTNSYRSWWRIPRKILFHWNRGTIVYDQNFIRYSSLSKRLGSEGFVQEFEAIMHWYHSAYHKLHSLKSSFPGVNKRRASLRHYGNANILQIVAKSRI